VGLGDHPVVCVLVCIPKRVKAGRVESEETAVARQRFDKHFPVAMNTHATTEELLEVVFYAVRVVSNIPHVVKKK
jgi:hypothetical protein